MSEEIPAILSDPPVPVPVAQPDSLGAILRAAREQNGMDVDEAARQLRLSPRQLMALEADDIGALPSPTFARGFIRNYARLLQLESEPLLVIYRRMMPENATGTSISLHSEDIPIQTGNRSAWLPYLAFSVVLGVAVGGWWAYMDWRDGLSLKAVNSEKVLPAVPVPPSPVATEQQTEPSPTEILLPPEELPQPSASLTPPIVTLPATPPGTRILMKFTQPSWVRVLDRDGKEIFQKSRPENTEDAIEGNPPFKVEIGNAAGVQLSYNGQPIDLAPHTKANVARLTLE
jgi:cytoskeleton protein RodZ